MIGVEATLLDIVASIAIIDSIFVDLVLYLGALGLIWALDLQP